MMDEKLVPLAEVNSKFLLYNSEGGSTRVQVRLYEGSVWLSQDSMADLYDRSPKTISGHINNIFDEGELRPEDVIRYYDIEQMEGDRLVRRPILCYNLDMILAVGYRVRASRGTQFRQWATKILHEYTVKGFVLDDERLSNPPQFGEDYFDELLERIRVIRASEKRLYLKVREIYALSVDYNPSFPEAKKFFATVQNKIHYAVHQHTAAELIVLRANADLPNMGLRTWKNSPNGRILKTDATVAKNYLDEEELRDMNSLVNQFLEYAETQARRRIPMTMRAWEEKLNDILKLNDRALLYSAGHVSMAAAQDRARSEFASYSERVNAAEKKLEDEEFENLISDVAALPNRELKTK